MSAIFIYKDNDIDDLIDKMGSYLERASLQNQLELEEHMISQSCSSSSSVFLEEAKEIDKSFKAKIENAARIVRLRLSEFYTDTKGNFKRYFAEKAFQAKIRHAEDLMKEYPVTRNIKVPWKDYKPLLVFFSNEKAALKRLVRKKGTTSEEIKLQFDRYLEKKSRLQKIALVGSTIGAMAVFSKGFIDGYLGEMDNAEKSLSDIDISQYDEWNENTKEVLQQYLDSMSNICKDEANTLKEYGENIIDVTYSAVSLVDDAAGK